MQCGISTSCFFPMETLDSLRLLGENEIRVTEIFLNTYGEMEDTYVTRLLDVANQYQIRISSLHPWSSPMDGFFFASTYKGRMRDGISLYRRYFEICRLLGAKKLVFHGNNLHAMDLFPFEEYVRNFGMLAQIGREYGVTLCHENVSYCVLADPNTVRTFYSLADSDAAFVMDTKQARRYGISAEEMLSAMQDAVRHVHISDYSLHHFCLPPGKGELDFAKFLANLASFGYDGDLIIELYRDNFADIAELIESKKYIESILNNVEEAKYHIINQ